MMRTCCCKLSPCALALAFGLIWAFANLFTGLGATYFEWGRDFVTVMGSVYIGFDNTVLGSLIGAGWALLDGFIAGFIFAFLYNCFSRCKCQVCCPAGSSETRD